MSWGLFKCNHCQDWDSNQRLFWIYVEWIYSNYAPDFKLILWAIEIYWFEICNRCFIMALKCCIIAHKFKCQENHKKLLSFSFWKTGKIEAPLCHNFILYSKFWMHSIQMKLKSLIHFKCFSFISVILMAL